MLLPVQRRQSRTFCRLSRISRGASELPSRDICTFEIQWVTSSARVLSREQWVMTTDGLFPVMFQPQTESGLLRIPFTLLCRCISHSTPAITQRVYQVFLWGLRQPWQGTWTIVLIEIWQQCPEVLSLAQVTFSLNSQSLFSQASCDDCVLRHGFQSAACVDGFLRFPGFTLRFRAPGTKISMRRKWFRLRTDWNRPWLAADCVTRNKNRRDTAKAGIHRFAARNTTRLSALSHLAQ